jgi:hypothetical protein
MNRITTPFPATPGDVAALSVREFTFDLDDLHNLGGDRVPSIARVCRTFMDDANRALVWWIRFNALKAWCARADAMARLNCGSVALCDACEVAAVFSLNHHWEFEAEDFCSAVEAMTAGRARA